MIRYSVRVDRPREHRAQFTLHVDGITTPTVDLVLPSWIPGSYIIQDPSRAVREVTAWSAGRHAPLGVRRVAKDRWQIRSDGASEIEVAYVVYGYQMVNEALDVTEEHLFLNAGFCLFYVDGRKGEPYEVALHLPSGWRVFADLPQVAAAPPTFRAADYDELVDSPIDAGTPVELTFTAAGIPHRIVLCGAGGNYEAHRLEADLKRIGETTIRLFGGSPLRQYTYFFHLSDVPDGALEHRASNSAVVVRTAFRPASAYRYLLKVAAHEYFHLYNVKRIRPKALGPFDYTREVYTTLLWAMEGTTDYYAWLLLRRSGLVSVPKSLESFATYWKSYVETPGRSVTDLETLSIQTWVDLYHPYEETRNQSVSYYLKGTLVSLALDLEIRHRSENRTSLDDVFRHLYTEYAGKDRGLEEEELLPVVDRVTGLSLGDFFDPYIRGTTELDLNSFVAHAGLTLAPKPKEVGPDDDAPPGYFGVDVENRGGLVRVARVLDGTPARRDGIAPGDEIVALDGSRVLYDGWSKMLEKFPAGTAVDVALFRRGYLTHATVTLGTAPPDAYQLTRVAEPTPLAKKIYESWLDAVWESPTPKP